MQWIKLGPLRQVTGEHSHAAPQALARLSDFGASYLYFSTLVSSSRVFAHWGYIVRHLVIVLDDRVDR